MRTTILSSLALVFLAAVHPVDAKTVVEFTDGRYLEVHAHEVLEHWVRLEVRQGSTMVIPARRIEVIELDDREVYRQLMPAAIATAEQDSGSDRQESLTAGRGTPRDDPASR